MPKLDVNELKALLAEAEEKGHEDVDLSHIVPDPEDSSEDGGSERRGSFIEISGSKAVRSTALMTRELTDLYRQAIAQTADGSLGFEDIKALVTSFAGMEPSETQMKGIMAELDEDGDGDVTESEWVNFGLKQLGAYVSAEQLDEDNDEENLSLWESYKAWWHDIDWEDLYYYMKESTTYFLEDAKVEISFERMMIFQTLFVLFADNIKLLAAPKSDDFAFDVVNSIILFFFILELMMNSWAGSTFEYTYPFKLKWEGYFLSFDWALNLISILSMFPDISWISNGLGFDEFMNVQGNNNITGVGKIIRLVRLVRLVKLYTLFMESRKRMQYEKELYEQVKKGDITYDDLERQKALRQDRESELGSLLEKRNKKWVIVLVLIIVIIMPVISYSETNYAANTAADMLHQINGDYTLSNSLKGDLISETIAVMNADSNPQLVYLYMSPYDSSGPLIDMEARQASLRSIATLTVELGSASLSDDYGAYTKAVFDNNALVRTTASLNIGMTIFVGTVLVMAIGIFQADAQKTVLTPISRMMNMVSEIVKDPLQPLSFDHSHPAGPGETETRLLENTVEKITGLLRVGFGEAGAGIISANLNLDLDSGRKVNPLLPGVKVYVIVGFCDIHHFEEVLVKLTDDVLTFVNTIAEIVHENVAHWGGQCNKNLGNAFVILWRIADEEVLHAALNTSKFSKKSISASGEEVERISSKRSRNRGEDDRTKEIKVDLRRVPGINIPADQALIGYLKIIAEINRNKSILKYRNEPRLTHNGTESFKVSMGFGLHAGWAIEGAVGSLYKVDATYLSPHVNMAARLETSSRQYGVPLLASQDVYDLFSSDVQKLCRRVDVVTVKGSAHEIGIYTYDCLEDQVFRSKPESGESKKKESKVPGGNTRASYELEDAKVAVASEAAARVTKQGKYMQVIAPLDVDYAPGFLATNQNATVKSSKGGVQKQTAKLLDKKDDNEIQEGFFLTNASDTVDVFEMDDDLTMLRAHVKDNFSQVFEEGIKVYLEGDWTAARNLLEQANKLMAEAAPSLDGDGPCQTLLSYMEARNWKAPDDWQGFRPLTSK